MTDKELQKLNRRQLLEIMVEQSRRIKKLEAQLAHAEQKLADRAIKIENAGSIAQAALALTDIFEKAQQAADLYLESVKETVKDLDEEEEEAN